MSGATAASTKVWRRLGGPARDALLRDLPGAELTAILLDISRVRASDLSDADLARHWREDPFLAPSTADPRDLLRIESALWDLLPPMVVGLDLSPLAPLGSVSRLSGIGQNRALVTARGSEMIFDPVQPLALEASRRRRSGQSRVHLAAVQKVVQAWDDEGAPHDRRFGFVSSSPDTGGATTEADLIEAHLAFWRRVSERLVPDARIEVMLTDPAIARHVAERGLCDETIVECKPDDSWNHPYVGAAFRLVGADGDVLGDGGLLPWTQLLTKNRKDRFLASGASLNALLAARS